MTFLFIEHKKLGGGQSLASIESHKRIREAREIALPAVVEEAAATRAVNGQQQQQLATRSLRMTCAEIRRRRRHWRSDENDDLTSFIMTTSTTIMRRRATTSTTDRQTESRWAHSEQASDRRSECERARAGRPYKAWERRYCDWPSSTRRCHIKMSPPWKICPGEIITDWLDMSPPY